MLAMAVSNKRRILVVGMIHDDYVGSPGEGLGVAGFLISAVSLVAVVDGDGQAQLVGELRRFRRCFGRRPGSTSSTASGFPHGRGQSHSGLYGRTTTMRLPLIMVCWFQGLQVRPSNQSL